MTEEAAKAVARRHNPRPARLGAALGIASAALLYASLKLVHQWNPPTGALVVSWATLTLAAVAVTAVSLRGNFGSRSLAKLGLMLALISVAALALAGIGAAAGLDEMPACGGG